MYLSLHLNLIAIRASGRWRSWQIKWVTRDGATRVRTLNGDGDARRQADADASVGGRRICEMFSREKCAISVYLMPMHFECKRLANAISFQSRAGLPYHPVTPPGSQLSAPAPPGFPAKFTAHLLHCQITSQLLHLLITGSVAPKVVSTAPHPCGAAADWWVTHPEMFFHSAAPQTSGKSLDFAAKKAATQSVFCQPPDKLGLVEISTKTLQSSQSWGVTRNRSRHTFAKYAAHRG